MHTEAGLRWNYRKKGKKIANTKTMHSLFLDAYNFCAVIFFFIAPKRIVENVAQVGVKASNIYCLESSCALLVTK